jgi:Phosphomannomutase
MKMDGQELKWVLKIGLTHAPEEMKELKDITLNKKFIKGNGNDKKIENFHKIYIDDLIKKNKLNKKIKVVVACGNGTARTFAPKILKGIGRDVAELDCELDFTFPQIYPSIAED